MTSSHQLPLAAATALVTGATGGLGEAIAVALSARGTELILTGRREPELARLEGSLKARTVVCDLADRDAVTRLGDAAAAAETDVLIANAALPASGLLQDLSAEDIDRLLDVNLRAPIALARALAPGMAARGRGHLVFVSSLSGKAAGPASSLYSATKFGLRGFALGLREDLRGHGVGVSVVSPGFIRDAGMYAKAGVKLPRGVGTRSPEQVAEAVIRAIETNPAEIDVAPVGLRVGAAIGSVAPGLAAWGARRLGSDRISAEFAERQRDQR
ncbi:MAG: SDR family NAD(P)-dependent oxidoreductase [Solirubrobacteraceae bacterium]